MAGKYIERLEVLGLGAISSLLATALYFLLDYYSGRPLDAAQRSLFFVLGVVLGVPAISIFSYKVLNWIVKARVRPKLEEELRARIESELSMGLHQRLPMEIESKTGIVKIFNNFRECEAEILEYVKTSNSVRVFLQIGKTVLGGTTSFYDYLGRIIRPNAKVKILHASLDSPYLNERIAHERNSDYKEWMVDLNHAAQKIENLIGRNRSLKSREHKEGYIWRLFIFDDIAYVQPYLFPRDNSENAPVLKLSRTNTHSGSSEENPFSLYKVFLNYFDFKWDECTPESTSLSNLIPATDTTAVAAVVRYHQFYIFAVPARYIKPDAKETPFHGIGGKRQPGEGWVAALEREALEETGFAASITSSPRTRFHTTGAELSPIQLDDSPRPYCVYKRTREADPNFAHPEVLWLVGYEGTLNIKSLDELRPRAEVGALVCLTGNMLLRTLQEKVTYDDIDKARDGCRLIRRPNVSLNMNSRAIPAGLAIIAAAEQKPSYLRRL